MDVYIDQPVHAIMTRDVLYITPTTLMSEVADIFETRNLHHLPVLDSEGKVLGIISKSDYYKLLNHFTMFNKASALLTNKKFLSSLLAEEVMSPNVVTIHPEKSLKFAASIFRENLFHALPVVDEERLVGILTTHDLLNHAYRDDAMFIQ